MNNTFSNDQVSKPKKVLTAVFVVGVLLVSAIIINSIQSKTNLEAQTGGFFSRILSSIFRDKLDPLKRIPKDTLTFADQEGGEGNILLTNGDGEFVFNFDNLEGIQALAIRPDESGSAIVPDDGEVLSDSFIVTFKADPLATKTRELLEDRGVTLLPQDKNRTDINQEIKAVQPQINAQKSAILSQQNGLLSKLSTRYGNPTTQGKQKVFSNGTRDIHVRQLQTTLNAVTISNITEDELKEFVESTPNIARVEKARAVKADLIETPSVIHSEELQNYLGSNGVPLTGEGTIIAIVDTGVDYTHQDLGNCSFLVEGGCKVAYGYDFVNDDNDPMDDHGHGTHVAATAGGNGYYTQGNGDVQPLPGIAPQATIYAYKVLSASGSGSNIGVIQGIEACADPNGDGDISDRATVCSLSLGSTGGDPLDAGSQAADAAVDAGVIMTIAAGNAGPGPETIGSPGTSRKAITVGAACKPSDIGSDPRCSSPVASFSSRGPVNYIDEGGQVAVLDKPDIVSPGVNICAAQWGDWMEGKACLGDGEHIAINGTSMATPTVAGLMALLAQAHPDKTVAELKNTLMATATDLGLGVSTQGQGLVDGLTALEGLGIPNSILGIEGLPFYIDDLGGEQISTFSKTFTLTNISEETLDLSIDQETTNEGVSVSFPTSLSIEPGDEVSFPVTVTIDHGVASSGLNMKEIITFNSGEESVNLIIARRTPKYLVPEKDRVDFGLFHESETTFSETRTITVSNRMLEQSGAYSVSIEPYDIAPSYQDNISATTSVGEITIGPDGTTSFDVTITASSVPGNILKNDTYKTFLILESEAETVSIELTFFRGYSFEMFYGEEAPEAIILAGDSFQYVFYPNSQLESLVLKATKPGPYSAMAVYLDQEGGFDQTTGIFEFDMYFGESLGIVTYDVSKSKAEHRIENNYFGNICSLRVGSETGEGDKNFAFMGGGKVAFEYNPLPEEMEFSLACSDFMPNNNRILVSQMYLTEGLNQDFSLNDTTADISARYVYGFSNREDQDEFSLGVNICNFRAFRHPGEVKGGYTFCSYWQSESSKTITLEEGQTAVVEVRSLHTDTPESSLAPNYPAFRLYAFDEVTDAISYVSPEMFATSEKLYAWSNPWSGVLSTEETSGSMYEDNKINIVNDNFITIGVGPIVDTTMVKAFQNEFAFLTAFYNSFVNPYRYADGSTESMMLKNPNPVKVFYDFFRDGVSVVSTLFDMETIIAGFFMGGPLVPDSAGNTNTYGYQGPVMGDYVVSMDRIAKQNGEEQNGVFNTEVSFSVSESSIDSIPPVLENIQLISNGVLQNNFDPANPGELRISVNPGYGIQNHNLEDDENGAYEIDFMDDSIASFSIATGDTVDSLSEITNVSSSGDIYTVSLAGISASLDRKYFEINLQDEAGNVITYNFYLEVGTALDPLQLANESLLFCEQEPPVVNISHPTVPLDSGGDYVPVTFSVTNQDSLACQPSLFNLSSDTDQYDPVPLDSYKIRGTDNPPSNNSFATTAFTLSFGTIHPGQTSTEKTAYFRADEFFPDGEYQIGLTIFNTTQDITYPVSFFASVFGYELPPELACGREAPTITPFGEIASHPNGVDGVVAKSYQMAITNNDHEDCENTSFQVTLLDESPGFGSKKVLIFSNPNDRFQKEFLALAPGQTVTSNVFYKNFGVEDAVVPLTISVGDITPGGPYHSPLNLDASITYGTPPLPNYCDADFNGDGQVGTGDQLLFNGGYGTSNSTYDLDGSGFVGASDLILFLAYYGSSGCPVTDPTVEEESLLNNIADDSSITVSYDVQASVENGSSVYEYEITITNTSSEDKNNLVAYNLIPVSQAPFAEFIAASVPGIEVDTDTDALLIPSLDGGQAISIFITVTMPSS